ncbi:ABC transporter ATP-binding protein [Spiroplasma floricola]|uniref:ABC transporter ATP-binding protein/permease n=1 Tax=Spiroplasma floricola 23-6 TaxID=1336749 RepID=A0A2K8SEJ3_9MOLU|nr:ABC transporter B family permease/ATP-binding protein [Spiroplasma floricola]AUB31678.1 ABC transporter ATP-binding protein/permease [Spiroplasma floricola 23-6]
MKKKKEISNNRAFLFLFFKYYKQDFKKNWWIIPNFLFWAFMLFLAPLLTNQINLSLTHQTVNHGFWLLDYWGLSTIQLIIISVVLLFLNLINSFLFNWWSNTFAKQIETKLRNEILEKLVRQDISYYSDKKIGELLTNVISDSQIVGNQAVDIPMNVASAFSQAIIGLSLTFILEWRIALVGFVIFMFILISFFVSYAVLVAKYEKVRLTMEKTNGNVIDRVISIRLIKSTGTEDYETEHFKEKHIDYYKQAKPIGKWLSIFSMIVFAGDFLLLFTAPMFAAVFFGGSADTSKMEAFFQLFPSFVMAQGMLTGPIITLFVISGGAAMAGVSSARILRTLNAESILDFHYHEGIEIKDLKGDIVFKNINFRYPEKPENLILPNFNFTLQYGKSYAFVGETGSGKSTIAKLLLRFYDPTEGQILINNKEDLKELNLSTYLNHVGYVEQEPQILFGTVLDNIKYGCFDATDDDAIEACKKAELHALVMSWPEGYKTILGERGFMLSGGQKQRLIIARMFLKDPELLILDEATSALDNIVEKEIQSKLNQLMKGRTSVTIAHKLSTIKNVDHIIVLGANGGGIVQEGTFNELIKKPGHFKNLYEAGKINK